MVIGCASTILAPSHSRHRLPPYRNARATRKRARASDAVTTTFDARRLHSARNLSTSTLVRMTSYPCDCRASPGEGRLIGRHDTECNFRLSFTIQERAIQHGDGARFGVYAEILALLAAVQRILDVAEYT